MTMSDVRIKLDGLREFAGIVRSKAGPIRRAIRQWAARYRGFAQRQFRANSLGGGRWRKLKRKRRRGKLKFARILRDTGTLYAALTPQFLSKPGQMERLVPDGVATGFGGPAMHPGRRRTKKRKGAIRVSKPAKRVTVAQIAAWHNAGVPSINLPKRQIIWDPDEQTESRMAGDMRRALQEVAHGRS